MWPGKNLRFWSGCAIFPPSEPPNHPFGKKWPRPVLGARPREKGNKMTMSNVMTTDGNVKAPEEDFVFDVAMGGKYFALLGVGEGEMVWFQAYPDREVKGPNGKVIKTGPLDDIGNVPVGDLEKLAAKLSRLNARGSGIAVAVNEFKGNRRTIENVGHIRAVIADFDAGLPDKLPLEPTFSVESSPGKFHYYWRVDGLTPEQFTGVEAVLVAQYGADKNAKDLTRILRLPGSVHTKDPNAPFRVVVEERSGKTYTAEEILKAFPPAEEPRKATPRKPHNEKVVQGLLTAKPSGVIDPNNPRPIGPEEVEKIRALAVFLHEANGELIDRASWLDWGMALHHESGGLEQGFELWCELSELYCPEKFDVGDQRRAWESFTGREGGEALTLGTIFDRAKELGWSWPPLKSVECEPEKLAAYRATLDALAQKDAATASFEYARVANEFGVPRGEIAKLVQERRKGKEEKKGGKKPWPIDEPWPDPVDGAALLDELVATIERHAILPEHAPVAIALWILHAHAIDAATHSPILCLMSPEKRCGKTTVAKIVKGLAPRGFHSSNTTEAALFRMVEDDKPTLIIDEADTFLRDNPALRGILNAGHDRESAVVPRANSETGKVETFSAWAPKVIALINKLPDTLEDRSIVIPLERKKPHQKVDRLPSPIVSGFRDLRRRAARWTEDNIDRLRGANPPIPERLDDRASDNWRSLFAIADSISSEWGKKARVAALGLQREDDAEDSIGVQLLRDIRELFMIEGADRITPARLLSGLLNPAFFPESPWGTLRGGREIDLNWLGRNKLPSFKIYSKKSGGVRWYHKAAFEKAWDAYLEPYKADVEGEDPSEATYVEPHKADVEGEDPSDDRIGAPRSNQPRRRNTASFADSPIGLPEKRQGGGQPVSGKIGIFNRPPGSAPAPVGTGKRRTRTDG